MVVKRFEGIPVGDGPIIVPITTDQYHAMIGRGIFQEGAPIELIDGMLVYKDRSMQGEGPTMHHPAHASGVRKLQILDVLAQKHGCHAQFQLPVTLPEYDEPEPDGAVVRGAKSEFEKRHPGPRDLHAVAEVSASSLKFDRTTKQRIYASADIPVYWIINVIDMQIEVYESPSLAEGRYQKRTDYRPGQTRRLDLDAGQFIEIAVSDLLPPSD